MPEEYQKCLVGLTAILREAWNTSEHAEDRREKIQALSLAKECYSMTVSVEKLGNNTKNNNKHFSPARNQKITVKRLFERLNFSITDNTIVIADVGDSLFGALDLTIHGQTDFLSPAYYCSMGFAVPAVLELN